MKFAKQNTSFLVFLSYLSLTFVPLYDSYGISTVENSNGYVFRSYISPGTSNSRTAHKENSTSGDEMGLTCNNKLT
jgi:hypothetical protein